ncbi:hypothetical protein [Pseudooceanicola sp.]|uniref:hypothetical protein n=1 Tax=Pseudooceanicola sp. TaxID=1914328 RepID=UPI00405A05B7
MSASVFTPARIIEAAIAEAEATAARESALPGPVFDPASGVAPEFAGGHCSRSTAGAKGEDRE